MSAQRFVAQPGRLLQALAALMVCGRCFAFAEDACVADSGGWQVCELSPCPSDSGGDGCSAIAMLTMTQSLSTATPGSRSTVHFDATYYLAQEAGFSPRDAYALAAYSEAADVGQFVYRGEEGQIAATPAACSSSAPPAECSLNTVTLGGAERNNLYEGGVYFHFQAPPAAVSGSVNGLDPDVDDESQEPFLNHLRAWALGEASLCVGGIASSGVCPAPGPVALGRMPFLGASSLELVNWISPLGEQLLVTDPATGQDTPASQLGNYVPAAIEPIVRLALYTHSYQDRISHHRCIDVSSLQGPDDPPQTVTLQPLPSDAQSLMQGIASLQPTLAQLLVQSQTQQPEWIYAYDDQQCDQNEHAGRHGYETGTVQATLDAEDQTSGNALTNSLVQLEQYALSVGMVTTLPTSQRDALAVQSLLNNLQTADAGQRVSGFASLAQQYGWLPLPLTGGLSYAAWDAQAGSNWYASHSAGSK